MANTEISYCARACIKLDADPIQSFDDGTKEAQVFGILYEPTRDSELTSHPWHFNTTNFQLSLEVAAPPDARYPHSYILPADHLRTISAYDSSGVAIDYLEENGRIFTDAATVSLKYQRRVDESLFPAWFQSLLVARLAYEAAEAIIGEQNVVQAKASEYRQQQAAAARINAQSNPPIQVYGPASSTWVAARQTGIDW